MTCTEPGPWCEGTAYGWRPDMRTGFLGLAGAAARLNVCRFMSDMGLPMSVCEVPR